MNNIHPINQTEHTLDQLSQKYIEAKQNLEHHKKILNEIECEIINLCGYKEEGASTFNTEHFKVTTTGKMSRVIDEESLNVLQSEIPQPLFERLFTYTPKLNLREYRYIQQNEPEYYKAVAKSITTKPSKPSLSIKAN